MEEVRSESIYSDVAVRALYLGYFEKSRPEILENLRDGFDQFYLHKCEVGGSDEAKPSESVLNYMKSKLRDSALMIFAKRAKAADLGLIREILDKYDFHYNEEVVRFFGKCGEWEDVPRIARLASNVGVDFGSVALDGSDRLAAYREASRVVLKIGSQRIADVLQISMPGSLRVQIFSQMSLSLFRAFDDSKLVTLLSSEDDAVREVVALKATLSLSKERLSRILESYYQVEGAYFYNSIFWIDLGISAPRSVSRSVAKKRIEERC